MEGLLIYKYLLYGEGRGLTLTLTLTLPLTLTFHYQGIELRTALGQQAIQGPGRVRRALPYILTT